MTIRLCKTCSQRSEGEVRDKVLLLCRKGCWLCPHRVRVFFFGERRDIAVLTARGIQLHIGCAPGRYKHPESFEKKYKIASTWK